MKKSLLAALMMAFTASAFAAEPAVKPVDDKYSAAHGFVSTKSVAEVQKQLVGVKKVYGWVPPDYNWKGTKTRAQVEAELVSYKADDAEQKRMAALYFGD